MEALDLSSKFDQINEYWSPHIIGELNGQYVKIAKLKGEFVWHSHESEDELFLVYKGNLKIIFRDRVTKLKEGQICIVPKGVEHKPIAESEVHVVLFEPMSTVNTGDTMSVLTKKNLKKI